MHPMKEFDPTKPAMVHDRLNDRTFEWKPATMQANYEKYAEAFGPDVIEWDGLLLDGWLPLGAQPFKLAVLALRPSLPVYPQHQTFPAPAGTSQKCQKRTCFDCLGRWDSVTRTIKARRKNLHTASTRAELDGVEQKMGKVPVKSIHPIITSP